MRPKSNLGAKLAEESLAAKEALEKAGLSLPEKPKYSVPDVPTRITEMGDAALMNLFVRHTRWRGYLSGQMALAEIEERYAEDLLARLEAEALIREWGGGREDRVTVAKAQRTIDPAVMEAQDSLHLAYARRKLVGALMDGSEKNVAVISRELTRRVGMEPTERRDRRWTP
jgi:hypothetical protein